jgi:uroporphyrinogen decarboxylase
VHPDHRFQSAVPTLILEGIEAEMRRVVPVLKESGGYIFSSDHSVPSSVSLEGFRHIVELARQLGRYE